MTGKTSEGEGLAINSIGILYRGPLEKKYFSTSRGKDKFPYPIGYSVTRTYGGHDFHMKIQEGSRGPQFVVKCEEGTVWMGESPEGAWMDAMKGRHKGILSQLTKRRKLTGAEAFGFHKTVIKTFLRQLLEEAESLPTGMPGPPASARLQGRGLDKHAPSREAAVLGGMAAAFEMQDHDVEPNGEAFLQGPASCLGDENMAVRGHGAQPCIAKGRELLGNDDKEADPASRPPLADVDTNSKLLNYSRAKRRKLASDNASMFCPPTPGSSHIDRAPLKPFSGVPGSAQLGASRSKAGRDCGEQVAQGGCTSAAEEARQGGQGTIATKGDQSPGPREEVLTLTLAMAGDWDLSPADESPEAFQGSSPLASQLMDQKSEPSGDIRLRTRRNKIDPWPSASPPRRNPRSGPIRSEPPVLSPVAQQRSGVHLRELACSRNASDKSYSSQDPLYSALPYSTAVPVPLSPGDGPANTALPQVRPEGPSGLLPSGASAIFENLQPNAQSPIHLPLVNSYHVPDGPSALAYSDGPDLGRSKGCEKPVAFVALPPASSPITVDRPSVPPSSPVALPAVPSSSFVPLPPVPCSAAQAGQAGPRHDCPYSLLEGGPVQIGSCKCCSTDEGAAQLEDPLRRIATVLSQGYPVDLLADTEIEDPYSLSPPHSPARAGGGSGETLARLVHAFYRGENEAPSGQGTDSSHVAGQAGGGSGPVGARNTSGGAAAGEVKSGPHNHVPPACGYPIMAQTGSDVKGAKEGPMLQVGSPRNCSQGHVTSSGREGGTGTGTRRGTPDVDVHQQGNLASHAEGRTTGGAGQVVGSQDVAHGRAHVRESPQVHLGGLNASPASVVKAEEISTPGLDSEGGYDTRGATCQGRENGNAGDDSPGASHEAASVPIVGSQRSRPPAMAEAPALSRRNATGATDGFHQEAASMPTGATQRGRPHGTPQVAASPWRSSDPDDPYSLSPPASPVQGHLVAQLACTKDLASQRHGRDGKGGQSQDGLGHGGHDKMSLGSDGIGNSSDLGTVAMGPTSAQDAHRNGSHSPASKEPDAKKRGSDGEAGGAASSQSPPLTTASRPAVPQVSRSRCGISRTGMRVDARHADRVKTRMALRAGQSVGSPAWHEDAGGGKSRVKEIPGLQVALGPDSMTDPEATQPLSEEEMRMRLDEITRELERIGGNRRKWLREGLGDLVGESPQDTAVGLDNRSEPAIGQSEERCQNKPITFREAFNGEVEKTGAKVFVELGSEQLWRDIDAELASEQKPEGRESENQVKGSVHLNEGANTGGSLTHGKRSTEGDVGHLGDHRQGSVQCASVQEEFGHGTGRGGMEEVRSRSHDGGSKQSPGGDLEEDPGGDQVEDPDRATGEGPEEGSGGDLKELPAGKQVEDLDRAMGEGPEEGSGGDLKELPAGEQVEDLDRAMGEGPQELLRGDRKEDPAGSLQEAPGDSLKEGPGGRAGDPAGNLGGSATIGSILEGMWSRRNRREARPKRGKAASHGSQGSGKVGKGRRKSHWRPLEANWVGSLDQATEELRWEATRARSKRMRREAGPSGGQDSCHETKVLAFSAESAGSDGKVRGSQLLNRVWRTHSRSSGEKDCIPEARVGRSLRDKTATVAGAGAPPVARGPSDHRQSCDHITGNVLGSCDNEQQPCVGKGEWAHAGSFGSPRGSPVGIEDEETEGPPVVMGQEGHKISAHTADAEDEPGDEHFMARLANAVGEDSETEGPSLDVVQATQWPASPPDVAMAEEKAVDSAAESGPLSEEKGDLLRLDGLASAPTETRARFGALPGSDPNEELPLLHGGVLGPRQGGEEEGEGWGGKAAGKEELAPLEGKAQEDAARHNSEANEDSAGKAAYRSSNSPKFASDQKPESGAAASIIKPDQPGNKGTSSSSPESWSPQSGSRGPFSFPGGKHAELGEAREPSLKQRSAHESPRSHVFISVRGRLDSATKSRPKPRPSSTSVLAPGDPSSLVRKQLLPPSDCNSPKAKGPHGSEPARRPSSARHQSAFQISGPNRLLGADTPASSGSRSGRTSSADVKARQSKGKQTVGSASSSRKPQLSAQPSYAPLVLTKHSAWLEPLPATIALPLEHSPGPSSQASEQRAQKEVEQGEEIEAAETRMEGGMERPHPWHPPGSAISQPPPAPPGSQSLAAQQSLVPPGGQSLVAELSPTPSGSQASAAELLLPPGSQAVAAQPSPLPRGSQESAAQQSLLPPGIQELAAQPSPLPLGSQELAAQQSLLPPGSQALDAAAAQWPRDGRSKLSCSPGGLSSLGPTTVPSSTARGTRSPPPEPQFARLASHALGSPLLHEPEPRQDEENVRGPTDPPAVELGSPAVQELRDQAFNAKSLAEPRPIRESQGEPDTIDNTAERNLELLARSESKLLSPSSLNASTVQRSPAELEPAPVEGLRGPPFDGDPEPERIPVSQIVGETSVGQSRRSMGAGCPYKMRSPLADGTWEARPTNQETAFCEETCNKERGALHGNAGSPACNGSIPDREPSNPAGLAPILGIKHPLPVLSLLVHKEGPRIRLAACCGERDSKVRDVLLYRICENGATETSGGSGGRTFQCSLEGSLRLEAQREDEVSEEDEVTPETSGLRLDPDGNQLVMIDTFRPPVIKEHVGSEPTKKNFIRLVQLPTQEHVPSGTLTRLECGPRMRCLLVLGNTLVAGGDGGSIACWKMEKGWRGHAVKHVLPTARYHGVPFHRLVCLSAVPGHPNLVAGCAFRGSVAVWDIEKGALVTSCHALDFFLSSIHVLHLNVQKRSKMDKSKKGADMLPGVHDGQQSAGHDSPEPACPNAVGLEAEPAGSPGQLAGTAAKAGTEGPMAAEEGAGQSRASPARAAGRVVRMEPLPLLVLAAPRHGGLAGLSHAVRQDAKDCSKGAYGGLGVRSSDGSRGLCRAAWLRQDALLIGAPLDDRVTTAVGANGFGVAGTLDGSVYVWDVKRGERIVEFTHLQGSPIRSIGVHQSLTLLAAAAADGRVVVYAQ